MEEAGNQEGWNCQFGRNAALGASKQKAATSVEKTQEQVKQREKDGNERVLSGVPNSSSVSCQGLSHSGQGWAKCRLRLEKKKKMCGTKCRRNWKNSRWNWLKAIKKFYPGIGRISSSLPFGFFV